MTVATVKLDSERQPGLTRLRFAGVLDLDSAATAYQQALASADGAPLLELDLSAVTHIDGAGLALLVALADHCQGGGISLRLADVSEPVRRALALTRLDAVLAGCSA